MLVAVTLSSVQVVVLSSSVTTPSWMSISPNIKFKATKGNDDYNNIIKSSTNEAIDRFLSSSIDGSDYDDSNTNVYTSGLESLDEYYDSYQLAWRLLGFFVDCTYGDNEDNRRRKKRSLNNNEDESEKVCKRMVMYGVYVDLDYEGNGIGEYEFYDRDTGEFTCYGDYCRQRMDCHLPDTNWKMLGIFKVDEISEEDGWMEQLFKHEGVCVWTEDEYELADEMREEFPSECGQLEGDSNDNDDGYSLYYDVKPLIGGNITLGLYTDSSCSVEYEGDDVDVFSVVGIDESDFDAFNSAMNIYKTCQSCIAYDLEAEDFQCDDEAGYTNCDQCMKFSNKAGCTLTDQSEISMAVRQNTLLSFELNGDTYGNGGVGRDYVNAFQHAEDLKITYLNSEPDIYRIKKQRMFTFPFFILSCSFFAFSTCFYVYALISNYTNINDWKRTPLIDDKQSYFTYCGNSDTSSEEGDKESSKFADPTIVLGGNVSFAKMGVEGMCYFYDTDNKFEEHMKQNGEINIKYHRVASVDRSYQLKKLIQTHFNQTGSDKAKKILENWDRQLNYFWQIYPAKDCDSPVIC